MAEKKDKKDKKEKKPKKEKKAKPPKEKKPKKEKKPREKKPKKEKPKKEKKAKPAKNKPKGQENGEEGGDKKKGGGKLKLLLIILPVLLLITGVAFFVLHRLRPMRGAGDDTEITETENAEEGEGAEALSARNPDGEAADAGESGDSGESGEAEQSGEISDTAALSGGTEDGGEAAVSQPRTTVREPSITTGEAVSYFRSLSPGTLGLPGENMSDYDVFPVEGAVLIDGEICVEVQVFSDDGRAGTNDIMGLYYLSRGGSRRLYRWDAEMNAPVEIAISAAPRKVQDAVEAMEEEESDGNPAENPEAGQEPD